MTFEKLERWPSIFEKCHKIFLFDYEVLKKFNIKMIPFLMPINNFQHINLEYICPFWYQWRSLLLNFYKVISNRANFWRNVIFKNIEFSVVSILIAQIKNLCTMMLPSHIKNHESLLSYARHEGEHKSE